MAVCVCRCKDAETECERQQALARAAEVNAVDAIARAEQATKHANTAVVAANAKTDVRPVLLLSFPAALLHMNPVTCVGIVSNRATTVYLSFGPIEPILSVSVTEACAQRPGACDKPGL